MTYTPTNWSSILSPSSLFNLVNTNTNNWGWVGILYTFWFVAIIALIRFGWEVALLASSFLAIIAALLLSFMNVIAWEWVLFFIAVELVVFVYAIWSSERH